MWILKLFGALFIICAFGYLGICASNRLKLRCEFIKKICYSLTLIPEKIVFSKAEIKEVLNDVFKGIIEINRDGICFFDKGVLKSEEKEAVVSFIKDAGLSDCENEIKRVEYTLAKIEKVLKSAEEERKEKSRLYSVYGFAFGAAVALFFI